MRVSGSIVRMAHIAHESLRSCSPAFCDGSIRDERAYIISDLQIISPELCELKCCSLWMLCDNFGRADSIASVYAAIDAGCYDVSLDVLLALQTGDLLQSSLTLHVSSTNLWFPF